MACISFTLMHSGGKNPKVFTCLYHLKLLYIVSNWSLSVFLPSLHIIFKFKNSNFTSFEKKFLKSKSIIGTYKYCLRLCKEIQRWHRWAEFCTKVFHEGFGSFLQVRKEILLVSTSWSFKLRVTLYVASFQPMYHICCRWRPLTKYKMWFDYSKTSEGCCETLH